MSEDAAFVAVTEAWAVWLDETAAQDEEMTDGERSGFRVAATHLRAPAIRERVARAAALEGGDLAAVAAIVATAEQLAEKVQRAVGEEGDVFDFAAPERMAQADELSRELLPLAEEVLDADVVTKLEAHRCSSVAAPPREDAANRDAIARQAIAGELASMAFANSMGADSHMVRRIASAVLKALGAAS